MKITRSKIFLKIELHKNYTRNIIYDERFHDKKEQKKKKKRKPTFFFFKSNIDEMKKTKKKE
jgi:hypothetical protein